MIGQLDLTTGLMFVFKESLDATQDVGHYRATPATTLLYKPRAWSDCVRWIDWDIHQRSQPLRQLANAYLRRK